MNMQIINDWEPETKSEEDRLDAVTSSHYEVWSNRKQPTTTRK
jgi:hypothetical protein